MADAPKGKEAEEIEALKTLCAFLWKRSQEAVVLIETLRTLLEQRGVFSADEFDALHAEIQLFQAGEALKVFGQAVENAHNEWLRQLLASLQGPKQ